MTDFSARLRPVSGDRALSLECQHVRDLLAAFVDDEAGSEDAASVRAHVARCERCDHAARGLRLLLAALRGTLDVPVLAPRRLRLRVEQQFADVRDG
jgi:anti-sigma factor RsiW